MRKRSVTPGKYIVSVFGVLVLSRTNKKHIGAKIGG